MNKGLFLIILLFLIKAEAQVSISAFEIADSLYILGDYSKALQYYKMLPESELIQFKKAKTYEAMGNTPKAIKYYEIIVLNNPTATIAKYNYGRLLFKTSKFNKADSLFSILSNENKYNPNFIYQRGLIKEKQNDSTALKYYKKVYYLDANHINSVYKIAKINIEKRKFSEAEMFIEKGLEIDSTSIRFLNLKALKNYYTKEYHSAIDTFKKLIKLGKKEESLYLKLADSYYNVLAIEEATDLYKLLINTYDDKNYLYHYNLGICFMALHYNEKAIKQFNLAIALKYTPLDEEYFALARAYRLNKNHKKEIELLKKALEENPSNEIIHYQLLLTAESYYKDKKTVLRYYEKYLTKFGEKGKMRELAKSRMSDLKKEIHFND